MTRSTILEKAPWPSRLDAWFEERGWKPFPFQEEAWSASAEGQSGLLFAPTGVGKTLAALLGPLRTLTPGASHPSPSLLWITPLRALATDTEEHIAEVLAGFCPEGTVGRRTGDVSASIKRKQIQAMPDILISTPESVSLLLSRPEAHQLLGGISHVVVDEWHELLGSKRGTMTELVLAHLRGLCPGLQTWGLSASIGNLEEAMDSLLGHPDGRLIHADLKKEIRIESLIPDTMERFPWAGHLGINNLPDVVREIERANSSLLFTNTRAQAEAWFRALHDLRPDWEDRIALHHGSIDRDLRLEIEAKLREGLLQCVVCTSSLDLGVDFSPVDLVIQIGSPKGTARLLQRAGRSGHQPGAISRILCVPSHAFELIEFSAARHGIKQRAFEDRVPLRKPLDLLAQHLVTLAAGPGFRGDELLREVRGSRAYRELNDEEWRWTLDFVVNGGRALGAYPHYRKVIANGGVYRVEDASIARAHRMSIGTISSDSMVTVRFQKGGILGQVEESFIARLSPGDRFLFSGRMLELCRVRDMTAHVKRSSSHRDAAVAVWMGGRMPLSSQLARNVRLRLEEAGSGILADDEMKAVEDMLFLQQKVSRLPERDELLIELCKTRHGQHAFLFPFAGRAVHEGLAAVLAWRISQAHPQSLQMYVTDYGLELRSNRAFPQDTQFWEGLLSPEDLRNDLSHCLNEQELTRRAFRDISRVAGLVFQGYPGNNKSTRKIQASSSLLFEVFQRYDPENLLLHQARQEVLASSLDVARLDEALQRIRNGRRTVVRTERLSPFAFPIWAESMHEKHSSESWEDRVRELSQFLESKAAS